MDSQVGGVMRVFDRRFQPDLRNRNFLMREMAEVRAIRKPRSYTWKHVQLDQGSEGACVGHAVVMEAAARPAPFYGDPVNGPTAFQQAQQDAFAVYRQAQKVDIWEGEDYSGTSLLAGMKIGVQNGYWKEYRWADPDDPERAVQEMAIALGYNGPVVVATDFYEGMAWPHPEHAKGFRGALWFMNDEGAVLGGHAYLLTAYNVRLDAFWTPNSWGGAGQGWIRGDVMVRLMSKWGEAALPSYRQRRLA